MADDVTLDDVAHKAGVSRATASRALNNRDGVRDNVRERVQLIAVSLGYRPNRSAKNLAGGRASVIGLVLGRDQLAGNFYAASLLQEVAKAAEKHDEGLMLLLDSAEPSTAVRNLLNDGLVDGVIVSIIAAGQSWVEELLDARVPTVLIGTHPGRSDVPAVDTETLESTADIVGHLLDTGCRRVATITGPPGRVDASKRLEGFRLAHARRSLPVDESLVLTGDFSRSLAYQLTDQLLDRDVDAIFGANDDTALGVIARAVERGVDVPGALSVAGFDGSSGDATVGPRLTSVRQAFDKLAMAAVETLIGSITDGTTGPQVTLISPTILYGDTTRDRGTGDPAILS